MKKKNRLRGSAVPVGDGQAVDQRVPSAESVNLKLRLGHVFDGEHHVVAALVGSQDDGFAARDHIVPGLVGQQAAAEGDLRVIGQRADHRADELVEVGIHRHAIQFVDEQDQRLAAVGGEVGGERFADSGGLAFRQRAL